MKSYLINIKKIYLENINDFLNQNSEKNPLEFKNLWEL